MEDMIKSIKKADFLLFLYTSGSQPGFMVLANELNIPTICTNVGALKENQENGGRGYCIKPNVKELVNILNILGVKEQNKIPEFKPYKDKIITKY